MEDISISSELTTVNGISINASVGNVETSIDTSERSGPKSYTLLQGANPNGVLSHDTIITDVGMVGHLHFNSRRPEPSNFVKKPCPLEMSIKAANLDTEFENESYLLEPALAMQPSMSAFGSLVSNESQPIINMQPAPLQVLVVQLQPQCKPPSPKPLIISVTREKSNDLISAQSITETRVPQPTKTLETPDKSAICVDVDLHNTPIKRKPEEESLIMKFRKVPCKKSSKRYKKMKMCEWSDSDEETLADVVKRKTKDKCCSRRCNAKIPLKKQEIAVNQFKNLELDSKGDLYLASCIKPIDKQAINDQPPLSPLSNSDDDILKEIAHESNGNQSLSDEIQNAIKESLKDQESSKEATENTLANCDWQYSIVVLNRSRIVCLRFLMSVLQIPESRLTQLKEKILNGEVLDSLPVTELRSKYTKVWEIAKQHLDTVSCTPLPYCQTSPPHLTTYPIDVDKLFSQFIEFYRNVDSSPISFSLASYEKFLRSQKITTTNKKACTICESLGFSKQKLKKKNKTPRGDVFSLMLKHLKTIPSTIPQGCRSPKPHKFFSPARITIPMLYEEYRKYFLKETNSELGLRYTIYESLLTRNPFFTIADFDDKTNECPKCILVSNELSETSKKKQSKKQKDCKKKRMRAKNGR